jgi:hypothetical protein
MPDGVRRTLRMSKEEGEGSERYRMSSFPRSVVAQMSTQILYGLAEKCHWIFGTRSALDKKMPEIVSSTVLSFSICNQVFVHLQPYDILRLAWTSKALRGILMRHCAISVWKNARSNVEGLPDCPR